MFSGGIGYTLDNTVRRLPEERQQDLGLIGDAAMVLGGAKVVSGGVVGIAKSSGGRSAFKLIDNNVGAVGDIKDVGRKTVVLGKYPNYENLAREIGADYFKVAPEVWDDLLRTGQEWSVNKNYLDIARKNNSRFLLSDDPRIPANFTGSYAKEIIDMKKNGYVISPDGTELFKRGKR